MKRWMILSLLFLTSAVSAQQGDPPPEVKAAMRELWRRGNCLLSSVHEPAGKQSAVPRDVGDTPVFAPRVLARQGRLLCYAADGETLWAADDQALYQLDGAAGRLVKRFDSRDGLPEAPIQCIAPAGGTVWLITRDGLARCDAAAGAITPVPAVEFTLARATAGEGGVWIVSDAGAFRLAPGEAEWRKLPDFPGQGELAQVARRGFWAALWRGKLLGCIPSVFSNADGLYVVCMNRLLRYAPDAGEWRQIGGDAWQAMADGRTVWAMTTGGVLRYDGATGQSRQYPSGQGPAAGRPVAMAAAGGGFFLASEPDYDDGARKFVGGGISRLDTATGEWTVTEQVDGTDIRFLSAVLADGDDVWAACTTYDKVVELGAHPGMAHVKRWQPHADGLGLLRWTGAGWQLVSRRDLGSEPRWVMGQQNTLKHDSIRPKRVEALCSSGGRLWGVYRMIPEIYYAGYYLSFGCLAARSSDQWQGAFDLRTEELNLTGEQPELMLLSQSHGVHIVLAEGHPTLLGVEQVAGRAWTVFDNGVFVHDAGSDRFAPVVQEGPRLYWRPSAGAASEQAVWFGGDGGTVSRHDRATGRLELVGVVPGREIVSIAADGGRVCVQSKKSDVVLPVYLRSATELPDADVVVFDGQAWSAGSEPVQPAGSRFSCQSKSNYVLRDGKRAAFLKGLFRPAVLCEDPHGGKLWLAAYSGVAAIPLPAD